MSPQLIRRLVLVGAMALTLAACGGSSGATAPTLPSLSEAAGTDDAAATTTTTEVVDPEVAFQEYAACMREHGIEMPDPGAGDGGAFIVEGDALDFEAMDEAAAECDPILEAAFGEFEMSPEMEAEMRDQELAFAQCMRANGVADWPDPGADAGGMIELGDDVDPGAVEEAINACSSEVFGDMAGVVIGGSEAFGGGTP